MDASSGAPETLSTLADWLRTPLGRHVLGREAAYFDQTVADIFGFYALQIGLPEAPFLAQSRIPSRWTLDYDPPAEVIADPHYLPFAENSIDLIVMPHALEFTEDPHLMLREAYRVIRPEGQIVVAGFNPFSLFGAKRYFGRRQTPPWNGNFIALYRVKDWLTLLGFDVIGGRLDAYTPPFEREQWLDRSRLFESAGDRWWPIAGGVYFLRATKRVHGMRVITPSWQRRERRKALAPAARVTRRGEWRWPRGEGPHEVGIDAQAERHGWPTLGTPCVDTVQRGHRGAAAWGSTLRRVAAAADGETPHFDETAREAAARRTGADFKRELQATCDAGGKHRT